MKKTILLTADRNALMNTLINLGDKALTDGMNNLIPQFWDGDIDSAGWKNFPYFSIKQFKDGMTTQEIKNVFDSWVHIIDRIDEKKAAKQNKRMNSFGSSVLVRNPFFRYIDKKIKYLKTIGIKEIIYPNLFRSHYGNIFRKKISQADLVVLNGAGLLSDHLDHYLPMHLFEAYYAKQKQKKVISVNQTISLKHPMLKKMLHLVYKDLDYHIVREPLSKQALLDIGIPDQKIKVAPDSAFSINIASLSQTDSSKKREGICFIIRGDYKVYFKYWDELFKKLKSINETPLFLAYTCISHDAKQYKKFQRRYGATLIPYNSTYQDLIKNLQNMELLVTDRYHGAIFGLMADCPLIAVSANTKKLEGLTSMTNGLVPYVNLRKNNDAVAQTLNHITAMLAETANLSQSINKEKNRLRQKSKDIYAELRFVINNKLKNA